MMARATVAFALALAGALLCLVPLPGSARAQTLDEAISRTAADMVGGARLAKGGRNIAVVSYGPALGEPLKLGQQLVRKVRIQMFDADRQRELRFISEGQVLNILVKEGMKQQSAMFDTSQSRKLGHLLTADMLVHGTYEVLGGGQVEIVTYLVDVQSGVTLAQSVQRASGVPTHLLLPLSAPAPAPRYSRITASSLSSNPDAAKKLRMAEIFEKRKRPERAQELLLGILQEHPSSLEAVHAQARLMQADLKQLRSDREYNEDFYQVVATLPPRYKKLQVFSDLEVATAQWLGELARTELSGGSEELAISYYEKAKALGLPAKEMHKLEASLRAAKVRAAMRQGQREEAEMLLVEWEVDEPDSPVRKELQKEFDRPKGMITIPPGKVNGRRVDAFNIDKYETTNREFLEFVRANPAYRKSRMTRDRNDQDYLKRWRDDFTFDEELADLPVVFVSAIVAEAYCKWRKKRLPSNLEWGLAAGEGRRKYPWGDQEPTGEIANFNHGMLGDPMPGDAFPQGATPEGVMNMGGNVWESTSTRVGGQTVARGGSYFDGADILRNDNRKLSTDPPTYSSRFTGIRCAQ